MRVGRVLRPPQPQRQALIARLTAGGGGGGGVDCSFRSGFRLTMAFRVTDLGLVRASDFFSSPWRTPIDFVDGIAVR